MKRLIEQIAATIRAHDLPSGGERLLVGVSGGADSVALLHALKFGLGREVTACHLNHCLRGEESDRDEAFVRRICAEWGIPCLVRRADVALRAEAEGISLEMAGREERYAWFQEAAARCGATAVATAHTRSDQTETFFLHLLRGSGLQGLGGIPYARRLPDGRLLMRPLLDCDRQMVEDYCREEGLSFVTDSTNLSDAYTRNQLRHRVLPILWEINPALDDGIVRLTALAAEENRYLNECADRLLARAACPDGEGWQAAVLAQEPLALRRRAFCRILQKAECAVDFQTVERLNELLEAPGRRLELPGGTVARVRGGKLTLGREEEPLPPFCRELIPGQPITLGDGTYCAALWEKPIAELPQKVQKNLLYLTLDYDTINSKLYLRSRRAGDEISLAGHTGTKSLKKLFIDARLTAYEKSAVPVLADESGVAAVYGFGPAARCGLTPATGRVLLFGRVEDMESIL